MHEYKFLGEITDFDLKHYVGLIGWIGDKPQKIYTTEDRKSFFLHDELTDRLFQFEAELTSFEGFGQYERVIEAYLVEYAD
jgi:hypothetical protein